MLLKNKSFTKVLKNWIFPIFIALFVILLLNLFFFKVVKYNGGAMEETLKSGNKILVAKISKINRDDIILLKNPLSDNSDLYVKRCVAMFGDTVFIENGVLFVNNEIFESKGSIKKNYRILAFDTISEYVVTNGYYFENQASVTGMYLADLCNEEISVIKKDSILENIKINYIPKGYNNKTTFPYSFQYRWNKDNFGPLILPKKGQTVFLNSKSLPLYIQIITKYENNTFFEKDSKYFINNIETSYYTFKKNYYFVLNDNRLYENDSRSWGLIPEDIIFGKAALIF